MVPVGYILTLQVLKYDGSKYEPDVFWPKTDINGRMVCQNLTTDNDPTSSVEIEREDISYPSGHWEYVSVEADGTAEHLYGFNCDF